MNHKSLTFIMVIICPTIKTCLAATLPYNTITTNSMTTTTYWPPKLSTRQTNWILPTPSNLPKPSPFRKLSSLITDPKFEVTMAATADSALRMNRQIFDHSSSSIAPTNLPKLHNIAINPYAQSLNVELETAFATVATYASNNNNNNNNNVKTPPEVATNKLNVDQSPTGAASTTITALNDISTFDWHRYFSMEDNSSVFDLKLQQLQTQPKQQPETTADEVYQLKRSREIEINFNKTL